MATKLTYTSTIPAQIGLRVCEGDGNFRVTIKSLSAIYTYVIEAEERTYIDANLGGLLKTNASHDIASVFKVRFSSALQDTWEMKENK